MIDDEYDNLTERDILDIDEMTKRIVRTWKDLPESQDTGDAMNNLAIEQEVGSKNKV